MSLSAQTLYPLVATSVELSYTHDRPLRYIATRYLPNSRYEEESLNSLRTVPCSLMFTCGISFNQESWLPVIKHLYNLSSRPGSTIYIRSMWVVERPNHGNSALLNERELKEHYSVIFPSLQYTAAIRAFLESGTLSTKERNSLICIGYSGGGGSLIKAIQPSRDGSLPLRRLIIVESPSCDRTSWPAFQVLHKIVKRSNARRQKSWASKEEAMRWMKTHHPWHKFHPDILSIISETYFRPDPERSGWVTTKTTVEQETASFVDDGSDLESLPHMRTMLDTLPTHLISGSINDIWTPALYKDIQRNVELDRSRLASVSVIDGVGHYLPMEKPIELAVELLRLLDRHVGVSHAKL